MTPYSSARAEGARDALVYLDANENPYPPYPGTAGVAGLNRYPDPQPPALLDRFAELYGVLRNQLFLSRGADEAIDLLVRAFCACGTDGILVTPPTFAMYETSAQVQGASVHRVPLRQDRGFALDVEAVLAVQSEHPSTKLVFVCSPNNPTGNLMARADILRLAAALRGKALVVADQLYAGYSGEPSLSGETGAHPNLVVLRSVSKEYSLAGERCGVTVAHPEVIGILGRIMAPYSLTVSSVRAVSAALTPEGIAYGRANIARIIGERERVRTALAASPAVSRVFPSDANFLLLQVKEPETLTRLMDEHGIKIRDRSGMVDGAVRISIGTADENDRMLEVLGRYTNRAGGQDISPRRQRAQAE